MRFILIFCLLLTNCSRDSAPAGEGSYKAAKRIRTQLAELKAAGPTRPLPPGYYRFTFDDGSWYVACGTDSHKDPHGGTVGMLTSDGDSAVFFTHVCGPGAMPLTFRGNSAKETIGNLRTTGIEDKP